LLESPKHQFQASVCNFQQELQGPKTPARTPLLATAKSCSFLTGSKF